MTEQPLLVRDFAPRFVSYNNTVLDLNALLSRQQRGKNQLEIWPNLPGHTQFAVAQERSRRFVLTIKRLMLLQWILMCVRFRFVQ